jgi:Peptidase family C25/Carboxypeptidase regulatory-like domain
MRIRNLRLLVHRNHPLKAAGSAVVVTAVIVICGTVALSTLMTNSRRPSPITDSSIASSTSSGSFSWLSEANERWRKPLTNYPAAASKRSSDPDRVTGRFSVNQADAQTEQAQDRDTARDQRKPDQRADDEEYDPDLPTSRGPKVEKEDYLERREAHINKLRGIVRGRPFDPSWRGKAISEMNRQERERSETNTTSSNAKIGDLLGVNTPSSSTVWSSIGPSPLPNGQTFNTNNVAVSGRITAIAIHPTNSNIAYVGAAQGGIFRTLDGGATWTSIFDNANSLAIGAITIAPSQPSTVYIGTGEENFSCDSYFGVGVYRIDNADGASPTLSGPFNQDTSNVDQFTGRTIGRILVHPTNPDIIFVGTGSGIGGISCVTISGVDGTAGSSRPRGLWRSTNATSGNPQFTRMTVATDNGGNRNVTDMEFEPGNPNVMFATVLGFNTAGSGGVYYSTDPYAANPTFTRTLAASSPSTSERFEISLNKTGTTVYVYTATSQASGTFKRGTYTAASGPSTLAWSGSLGTSGFCGGQCTYDMPIAVDPTDANVVYLGGSADSGNAHVLTKVTNGTGAPTFTASQNGLHADEHAIEIDPQDHNTIWTGNDGGIWKSTNAASNWTSLNNAGFVATQFQSLAVHSTDANFTIGGTQDNGTECQGPCGTFTGNTWNQADFGDGGFALIDQSQSSLTTLNMYHTYYNQTSTLIGYAYVTSTANAQFVSSPTTNSWSFNGTGGSVSCTNGGGYLCSETVEFYMPMALGPGSPNPVYTGTDRLHRAPTPGASNAVVSQSPIVSGVPITAIGISPQSDNVRIVGLENGQVWRTMTGSSTLVDVTGTIPAGYVSRAVIDPTNQNTAYVTLSVYFGAATSHVYKTTNLNVATPTWTGVDGGQIPDIPINAFVVDPANSSFLYAGTDIGVYRSSDGGTTWSPFGTGLPRVAVFDMAIQNSSRTLRIATHGRGMWEISIGASGTLQGTVTDVSTSNPISGATVTVGSNTTTTNGSGFYQITGVAVATYSVSASAPGYNSSTVGGVSITDSATTTQNFALTAAPVTACFTDTSQADFQTGTASNVDLTTSPGNVKLASSAGTLDQQNTTVGGTGQAVTTTTWEAQTFIPGVTGQLTQVDADLFCSGCSGTNPAITIEIRTTSGGLPTTTVLASTTITGFSSGTGTFYSATFGSPASLTAGTTYAVVARLLTDRTTGTYAWLRSNNNQYANGAYIGGTSCNSGTLACTWSSNGQDFGFKTYMSTGFASSGDLTSSVKDSNPILGRSAGWATLSWNATTPLLTTVKFQVAGSNSSSGPFNFVGPGGTNATYFTTSGASLSQFNGFRYLKYKAYLSTTNSSATPTLNDVTVCYDNPYADLVFNSNGSVAAATYNSITVNAPAVVTLTGNVTINGFVQVNSGGTLVLGTSIISGSGTFTLASGGILGIGSASGITSSGASGNVQGAGARSFSTGASYTYNGATNQAAGNGLPSTVANLTIANTGSGGNNNVIGNSGQTVTGLLWVQSGIYSSASTYHNVQIDSGATLSLAADVTVSGNWTNNGTFNSNGFKVTFDGNTNQSISGTSSTAFANLTVANTGVGNNTVSLSQNVSDTTLNVTSGKFDQGASSNLASGAITISSGATLQNLGTGDLTLSGDVSNSGTITFDGSGGGCGSADAIAIRSSVNGTQRAWSGIGSFSMTDVDVMDQAGSAIITVFSGTNSNNNGVNWIFINGCTGASGQTYVWVGPTAGNDSWALATNWKVANSSPAANRVSPATTDVMIFDGSTTPTPTVSAIPTQTIAALRIINGAFPSFSTSAANTLTIDPGAGGLGFDVNFLTVTGANGLSIKLNSGTGNVSGTMVVAGGAHRLFSNNSGAITFPSGSIFTTDTGFTGNAFGTGAAGNGAAGSVVFQSGSSYNHNAGSSPFGASGNPSVVTFQTGSEARYFTATGFDASGRTYANLVIGSASTQVVASQSGTGNFQFDNLVVNSTNTLQSSVTYTGSGASTVTIQGNITSVGNGNGSTFPDVILSAGTGGIQINKAGGGTLVFGNGVGTPAHGIAFESDATVDSSTTVTLGRIVQMGLTPTNTITVNGSIVPNSGAPGYIIGNEKRTFAGPGPAAFTFDVGTINGYSPVDAQNTTSAGNLTVTAKQATAPVVDATKSLSRYWTLSGSGITTNLTFHYLDPTDIPGTSTESNYRVIRVESGVSVFFQNDSCTTACVDTVNNTGTLKSVSHFSDWTLGEPAAPTAVKLSRFDAASYRDGVAINWESGFEVDNLGYQLYREKNGQREEVTQGVVAGSALKVGPQRKLTAGYSYQWFDKDGSADAAYYLEAIDLNGERSLTGPIYAVRGQGQSPHAQKRAALLSEVNEGAAINSPERFEQNFPASMAKPDRTSANDGSVDEVPQPQPAVAAASLATGAAVKISVSTSGWYRVTQSELVAAGLDANSDARRLQLFVDNQEIPMVVNANGGRFAAGDSIEFYGQALDTLSTDTHVYWLINGSSSGKRITRPKASKPNNQDWTPLVGGSFAMTVTRADKLIYFSSLLNGEASNIFGPAITSNPATQSLTVNNLDASSTQAQLSVTLQGVNDVAHEVQVQLNGSPVGTVSFTGRQHPAQSFTVSRALLHEGTNTVTLSGAGGGPDVSLVDSVSLTYAHSYRADNNALRFSVAAGQTIIVSGFTSAAIRVIDITNPAAPIENAPQISAMNGGYAFKLQTSGAGTRTFMALTDDLASHPAALLANQPANLMALPAADLLIVTYKDFRSSVEPLAAQRRSEGLTVSVVDIEDVYDEFSFGAHSPQALRDYLDYTNSHGTRPRYLLLVGDSSWDPRNSLQQGFGDFVPTKLIDTVYLETASDDWLSDFDGDGIADIATGRLPVRTAAEATLMVNKILAFEQERQNAAPLRGALLVSDSGFESESSATAALLPSGMSVTTINRADVGSDDLMRTQIVNNLNTGPLVANYFGHGSVTVWTGAGLLDSDLATSLTNDNRPTLFVLMTCLNGYSHDAYIDSLGESLLKAPQGGAMAVWASSGFTESDPQFVMSSQFYRSLFSSTNVRLGDAFKPAKATISDPDVQRTWLLLGDPSMRLR